MSSTHFEQLQNLLAGGDGSSDGTRRGSGTSTVSGRGSSRNAAGLGVSPGTGYGARAPGLSQLTDLLLEQSKAAAAAAGAGLVALDGSAPDVDGGRAVDQEQRGNGMMAPAEEGPSQPRHVPDVVPSSQGSGMDVDDHGPPGGNPDDGRDGSQQQQQQQQAAAVLLSGHNAGGPSVPTVIGPPSQPDTGAPQLLESQGGSQGLQQMLSAAEARLGIPGFLPLSGVDFASSLQSHPEFLGGFVWPLGSLPASLSQDAGAGAAGGPQGGASGPGSQPAGPGADGDGTATAALPDAPSAAAAALHPGGLHGNGVQHHHRLLGPGMLAAAAAAAGGPLATPPGAAGLVVSGPPGTTTGSGRRSGGRPTRRGPMDEMRQLVRILVKLLPQSAPNVGGGDEAGGGNRISEEQIKTYLEATLGSAPRPTWGVPRGWHVYLAELLSWARGTAVDEASAKRVAKREPGRSWEVVESELVTLGVHPSAWPLPLNLEGVRAAEADPMPVPVPVPANGNAVGGAGGQSRRSTASDAAAGEAAGSGSVLYTNQSTASRRGSKGLGATARAGFVLETASELDTWRHLVDVLTALPGKTAATPPAVAETAAAIAGLRTEARLRFDALLLASIEPQHLVSEEAIVAAGPVPAAGADGSPTVDRVINLGSMLGRSPPTLSPGLLSMFQGLQYVPALGAGSAGMMSLLGGFAGGPAGLTTATSMQQQPAPGAPVIAPGSPAAEVDDLGRSTSGGQLEPCSTGVLSDLGGPRGVPMTLAPAGLASAEDGPAPKKAHTGNRQQVPAGSGGPSDLESLADRRPMSSSEARGSLYGSLGAGVDFGRGGALPSSNSHGQPSAGGSR